MRHRLVLLIFALSMSPTTVGVAQQMAPTPPAPSAPSFVSRSLWRTSFSKLDSGDPRFAWIARVNADVDVVDYVRGRINFWGQYEGVLGMERRMLDLNHENFVVETSATLRVRAAELSAAFHHVSRHLSDRQLDGVVAWNTATIRAAHVLTARGTKYWGHLDFSKVLQHSAVDYRWIGTLEFNLEHPWTPRTTLIAAANGSLMWIRPGPSSRSRQCGARGEAGILFGGDHGGMEFYLAYETRSDAYPPSQRHADWLEVGFKLIGR